ncbi:hypothetical protein PF002_g2880 [Phytophthora fragariae]|uniref:Uncharacterized protein n=1 Tax=Phytophthora fragariae TaxID=53985 RepID=A0A6A4AAI2_9STRA|nr:hypothetical protein PF003_g29791 [Phytophthora fragariae]KAE9027604.1 hypothetical protein PF011_g1969 [Phytophthora fragariae]KAE9254417.1 hypothetical protein PF002_g2880 [Phytophthora fragariae]KAE9326754.1 hypothetical protein PF001_g2284 [Phytophthora fragariae]
MTPGRVLRDKTVTPAPVYREIGRDHSSDEDFVVDQATPDLDDSPDDSPDQAPPPSPHERRRERKESPMCKPVPRKEGSQPCDRHVDDFEIEANAGHAEVPADPDAGHADAAAGPDADPDAGYAKDLARPDLDADADPEAGHAEGPARREPDTSEAKPTECYGVLTHRTTAPNPKQALMPEPNTPPMQNPKKAKTPTQKPSHTSAKRLEAESETI